MVGAKWTGIDNYIYMFFERNFTMAYNDRNGKPGKKNDKLNIGDKITVEIPEPKAVDIAPPPEVKKEVKRTIGFAG